MFEFSTKRKGEGERRKTEGEETLGFEFFLKWENTLDEGKGKQRVNVNG